MSAYLTDDEQAEALKTWWRENGKSVIAGTVLGFAIIFGWQGWERYHTNEGEHASLLFTGMQNQLAAGASEEGVSTAKRLVSEHPNSVYATFAALQLAKVAYQSGESASAQSHLQWAMQNAPDAGLAGLARLRLARMLADAGYWDQVEKLLDAADDVIMPGEFAVLRGDVALHQGDINAAREAYLKALDKGVVDPQLVRMKLVDIGGESAS